MVPLSPSKKNSPVVSQRSRVGCPSSPTTQWADNRHLFTSGGFPPQTANTYVHPEVPTSRHRKFRIILLRPQNTKAYNKKEELLWNNHLVICR